MDEDKIEREQAKPYVLDTVPLRRWGGPDYHFSPKWRGRGLRDYPSRVKMMGRYLLWCGIGIGVFDMVLMAIFMLFGIDIYWEPIRVDVAIGSVAVFLAGIGLLMQFFDST